MNNPVHFVTLFVVAGLCACSGCALVPFPVSRTLPDPIRQVEVVQEGTAQPIADAEVVMHAERFKNWMRSFPPHYSADFTPAAETSIVVPLQRVTAGCFTPEPQRVRRYVRPWGLGPLGTTVHEDYTVTISVRAEGYTPVTAKYSPTGGMNADAWMARADAPFLPTQFGKDGTLTIFLRAKNAEPAGRSNSAPPLQISP
jgi:hypothetical protein